MRLRHLLLTLALLAAGAAATGLAVYHCCRDKAACAAASDGDALRWLRSEFHLTDAQYATILRLHETHSAACAQHCAAVRAARTRLDTSRTDGAPAAELAPLEAEVQRLDQLCRASVADHVRQVAAAMDPEEGRRYLALVLPQLAAFDHAAPPNLRLDR